MQLPQKIKKAVEESPEIIAAIKGNGKELNWQQFTRTHFNIAARVINKKITNEILANSYLLEMYLVIGQQKLEKEFFRLRCSGIYEFIKHLGNLHEYRVYNWVSGKTLQSYWTGGDAKTIKLNALFVFLQVPFNDWEKWKQVSEKKPDTIKQVLAETGFISQQNSLNKTSQHIIKTYYTGNYFLYYPKTDGSKNIVKTPFIITEHESGQMIVKSVSEGHRYKGKVTGIRDGCLYITNQNLDFDEMEQYVFNIGLETKPQVLFGVSNTVSVKTRLAVALKNILVKQKTNDPSFENIRETEIPYTKKYTGHTEEAIIVQWLRRQQNIIILTEPCCGLEEMRERV